MNFTITFSGDAAKLITALRRRVTHRSLGDVVKDALVVCNIFCDEQDAGHQIAVVKQVGEQYEIVKILEFDRRTYPKPNEDGRLGLG